MFLIDLNLSLVNIVQDQTEVCWMYSTEIEQRMGVRIVSQDWFEKVTAGWQDKFVSWYLSVSHHHSPSPGLRRISLDNSIHPAKEEDSLSKWSQVTQVISRQKTLIGISSHVATQLKGDVTTCTGEFSHFTSIPYYRNWIDRETRWTVQCYP